MIEKIRELLLSGRALGNGQAAGQRKPAAAWLLLPYFFFLNAVVCMLTLQTPFCFFIALVFVAWGATNLLFHHCHRCRDSLVRRSPGAQHP